MANPVAFQTTNAEQHTLNIKTKFLLLQVLIEKAEDRRA